MKEKKGEFKSGHLSKGDLTLTQTDKTKKTLSLSARRSLVTKKMETPVLNWGKPSREATGQT